MNYLIEHFKTLPYFLALLVLFQSCIIYRNKPAALEEVLDQNTPIKIKTVDGEIYKLNWIEEIDGKIRSVQNTKRHVVDTAEVDYVLVGESNPFQMHFKLALDRAGPYLIVTDKKQYKCMKIELRDEYLIGYEKKGNNTAPLEIPIDQIESIHLYDKGASIAGNLLVAACMIPITYIFLLWTGFVDLDLFGDPNN